MISLTLIDAAPLTRGSWLLCISLSSLKMAREGGVGADKQIPGKVNRLRVQSAFTGLHASNLTYPRTPRPRERQYCRLQRFFFSFFFETQSWDNSYLGYFTHRGPKSTSGLKPNRCPRWALCFTSSAGVSITAGAPLTVGTRSYDNDNPDSWRRVF